MYGLSSASPVRWTLGLAAVCHPSDVLGTLWGFPLVFVRANRTAIGIAFRKMGTTKFLDVKSLMFILTRCMGSKGITCGMKMKMKKMEFCASSRGCCTMW
jgi:hypothetical protein